jgi:hypothetical protein
MPKGVGLMSVTMNEGNTCLHLLPADAVPSQNGIVNWGSSTLLQKTEYYLCSAEHWLLAEGESIGSDLYNFVRNTLDGLWADLKQIWNNPHNFIRTGIQGLHDDALNFWNWLKAKSGSATKAALLLAAGAVALWFLPEILEGGALVGGAYAAKSRRSYRRYSARKARRAAA